MLDYRMAPQDKKLRIGVIASHGGTNLQAIISACAEGSLDAEIRVVISNNSRSHALERARRANIPTAHLSSVTHPDPACSGRRHRRYLDHARSF